MSGDYELLSKMYGISGAAGNYSMHIGNAHLTNIPLGRHCCLWCRITQQQLIEAPSARRVQPEPRDLHTLATAHSEFTTEGESSLDKAKLYRKWW